MVEDVLMKVRRKKMTSILPDHLEVIEEASEDDGYDYTSHDDNDDVYELDSISTSATTESSVHSTASGGGGAYTAMVTLAAGNIGSGGSRTRTVALSSSPSSLSYLTNVPTSLYSNPQQQQQQQHQQQQQKQLQHQHQQQRYQTSSNKVSKTLESSSDDSTATATTAATDCTNSNNSNDSSTNGSSAHASHQHQHHNHNHHQQLLKGGNGGSGGMVRLLLSPTSPSSSSVSPGNLNVNAINGSNFPPPNFIEEEEEEDVDAPYISKNNNKRNRKVDTTKNNHTNSKTRTRLVYDNNRDYEYHNDIDPTVLWGHASESGNTVVSNFNYDEDEDEDDFDIDGSIIDDHDDEENEDVNANDDSRQRRYNNESKDYSNSSRSQVNDESISSHNISQDDNNYRDDVDNDDDGVFDDEIPNEYVDGRVDSHDEFEDVDETSIDMNDEDDMDDEYDNDHNGVNNSIQQIENTHANNSHKNQKDGIIDRDWNNTNRTMGRKDITTRRHYDDDDYSTEADHETHHVVINDNLNRVDNLGHDRLSDSAATNNQELHVGKNGKATTTTTTTTTTTLTLPSSSSSSSKSSLPPLMSDSNSLQGRRGNSGAEHSPDDDEIPWRMDSSESLSDWILLVKDKSTDQIQTYHVHKNFLGLGQRKSEYFLDIFKKHDPNGINITELELVHQAASVIPLVLDYVYVGIIPVEHLTSQSALGIRYMSQFLGIKLLYEHVMKFIQEDLSLKTITTYYITSTQLGDQKIRNIAARHCARNITKIDTNHPLLKYMDPFFFTKILEFVLGSHGNPTSRTMNELEKNMGNDANNKDSTKSKVHVSLILAEYCRQQKDMLTLDIFTELTNDEYLHIIDPTAAVILLETELFLTSRQSTSTTGMVKQPQNTTTTTIQLTPLQERCIDSLSKIWKELCDNDPQQTVSICMKLQPHIVTELMIRSVKYNATREEKDTAATQQPNTVIATSSSSQKRRPSSESVKSATVHSTTSIPYGQDETIDRNSTSTYRTPPKHKQINGQQQNQVNMTGRSVTSTGRIRSASVCSDLTQTSDNKSTHSNGTNASSRSKSKSENPKGMIKRGVGIENRQPESNQQQVSLPKDMLTSSSSRVKKTPLSTAKMRPKHDQDESGGTPQKDARRRGSNTTQNSNGSSGPTTGGDTNSTSNRSTGRKKSVPNNVNGVKVTTRSNVGGSGGTTAEVGKSKVTRRNDGKISDFIDGENDRGPNERKQQGVASSSATKSVSSISDLTNTDRTKKLADFEIEIEQLTELVQKQKSQITKLERELAKFQRVPNQLPEGVKLIRSARKTSIGNAMMPGPLIIDGIEHRQPIDGFIYSVPANRSLDGSKGTSTTTTTTTSTKFPVFYYNHDL